MASREPKILLLDIETCPIESYTWGIWDQNVALNQIKSDWSVLSWAAKWLNKPTVMYEDVSKQKNKRDDSKLLKSIWGLLDQADIVISQNGKAFDIKKLNARFIINKMQPPSSFRQIDTLRLAKKYFAFTSNKLEYLSDKLCTKYKKLKHNKFSGFDLWKECLAGNKAAWREMRKYNKYDVLALQELYSKLIPWDNSINQNVYREPGDQRCTCGSKDFVLNGYAYTSVGKYQRFKCHNCGSELKNRNNLLLKEQRKYLKVGTNR